MLYIARIKRKGAPSKEGRMLRKIKGCATLEEAWEKIQAAYPEDKIVSVQLSKRKLNALLD